MQLFIVLALAIAFLAVLFALQNQAVVAISLFVWTFDEPLAVVLLVTLVLGVLIGLLVSIPSLIRRNWSIARQKKQIEGLEYQMQQHQTELGAIAVSHQEEQKRVGQSHQNLLTALAITEPVTGLLNATTAPQAASYLLQQSQQQPELQSVCAYVIEQNELQAAAVPQDQVLQQSVVRAIAHRLQTCAMSRSWLHADGGGRLICLTPGLTAKSALDYGETIRTALSDAPLTLENGTSVPANISIGGAIAESADKIDGALLLQQAAQALDSAKRRGQNRFRLEQISV
jgi:diguanylate cyclase (GGDEF)-like protein